MYLFYSTVEYPYSIT